MIREAWPVLSARAQRGRGNALSGGGIRLSMSRLGASYRRVAGRTEMSPSTLRELLRVCGHEDATRWDIGRIS